MLRIPESGSGEAAQGTKPSGLPWLGQQDQRVVQAAGGRQPLDSTLPFTARPQATMQWPHPLFLPPALFLPSRPPDVLLTKLHHQAGCLRICAGAGGSILRPARDSGTALLKSPGLWFQSRPSAVSSSIDGSYFLFPLASDLVFASLTWHQGQRLSRRLQGQGSLL